MHRQLVVNYVNWPNAFGLVLINVCAGFGVASIFFVPNNCGICSFEFALIYLPVAIICILFYQSFFWHCCILCFFLAMSFDFLCLLQKHKYKSNCICSMSLICIGICL